MRKHIGLGLIASLMVACASQEEAKDAAVSATEGKGLQAVTTTALEEMDFEHYGLGTQRTRQDYEKYAGIRFTDRGVQQHTLDNKFPPNPEVEDYDNSFHNIFKHCIDLHAPNFSETDYDFWAIIFEDKDGNEIYRQDADKNEIKNLLELSKKDNDWIRLWRTYTGKKPDKWVVWPHSVSKDWCERIEGNL